MPSAFSPLAATWLSDNGPKELELLLRAIVCHPSAPIFIADNERSYSDASSGAGKLLVKSLRRRTARETDGKRPGACLRQAGQPCRHPFGECGGIRQDLEHRLVHAPIPAPSR